MKTHIALLRGINVSGHKKIKMAELRDALSVLDIQHVRTYIQSGNILFESNRDENWALKIKEIIAEKFGFDVPVILLEESDLTNAIANSPFQKPAETVPNRVFCSFMYDLPNQEDINAIEDMNFSPEEFLIKGKVLHFYSPEGMGKSKLSNNFFERKLKVNITARNWKTVHKLIEMCQS